MQNADRRRAERGLETLAEVDHVLQAALYDRDGKLLGRYLSPGLAPERAAPDLLAPPEDALEEALSESRPADPASAAADPGAADGGAAPKPALSPALNSALNPALSPAANLATNAATSAAANSATSTAPTDRLSRTEHTGPPWAPALRLFHIVLIDGTPAGTVMLEASQIAMWLDIIAASFGSHFDIQGGKLVALDKHGIKEYSSSRPGEVATFDEALGQLIDRYPNKNMILREPGAPAPAQASGQPQRKGGTITRDAFDALPPVGRAQFLKDGGRVGDVAAGPAPAPASQPAGGKTMTRTQFDSTPPQQAAAFFKSGGKLVD